MLGSGEQSRCMRTHSRSIVRQRYVGQTSTFLVCMIALIRLTTGEREHLSRYCEYYYGCSITVPIEACDCLLWNASVYQVLMYGYC